MKLSHSGNLGDVVYALPTILALNKIHDTKHSLYLKPNVIGSFNEMAYHSSKVMMTNDGAEFLLPLLAPQDYLEAVEIYHYNQEAEIDLDLGMFRILPIDFSKGNICRWYFSAVNVCWDLSKPWLTVEPGEKRGIVVNRSFRYRNRHIEYGFLANYAPIYFVGLPEEFIAFQRECSGVEYIETRNALELARVIAGAGLFIGNQSLPFAIAEGLKVRRVLEVCPWCPNVAPCGPDAYDVMAQRLFEGLVERLVAGP